MSLPPKTQPNGEQIVLFTGQSQYDAAITFEMHLAEAFERLGFQTRLINLLKPTYVLELQDALSQGNIKCFFGTNGWGSDIKANDEYLFDLIQIPLVSWSIDHPLYHSDRLSDYAHNMALGFADESHLQFARQQFQRSAAKQFIPHGGCCTVESLKPFEDRELDLVFFGTFGNLNEIENTLMLRYKLFRDIIGEILEEAKFQNQYDLLTIFATVFLAHGIEIRYIHSELLLSLYVNVEKYVRFYRRRKILASIQHMPVHYCIHGREYLDIEGDNVHWLSPRSYSEMLEVFNNAKVVLNVMPNYMAAGHDRIFYAQLQGAASLTDSNRWLSTQFVDNQSIFVYDLRDDHLEDKVAEMFRDPERLANVAEAGRELAEQHHTWDTRAQTILELVEAHDLLSVLRQGSASLSESLVVSP